MSLSEALQVPAVLCHPDGHKSCGACCGMYNHIEHDAETTRRRLEARRRDFDATGRLDDPASLEAFSARHLPRHVDLLMPELPTCPFLGRLRGQGDEGATSCSKVGCMVHPLQNQGRDGRDFGVYDRFVCEDYLCAAHHVLRQPEKWLVIAAVEDSYTYGLVITDPLFVRQLFEQTADLNGTYPDARRIQRPEAIAAASRYFSLKADWRWRADDGVFGQVVAGRGLETPRREDPAGRLGLEPRPVDSILRCLGTDVATPSDLHEARKFVSAHVAEFARAVAP